MKLRQTLTGHEGIVHAIVVVGKRIITGSSDKIINVWDLDTMKCEYTLTGHNYTICKLVLHGDLLFSGSYTEIKVFEEVNRNELLDMLISVRNRCGM